MDAIRDNWFFFRDLILYRWWDIGQWLIVLAVLFALYRIVKGVGHRSWTWTVPDKIGVGVIVLVAVLFAPWLRFKIDDVRADVKDYLWGRHRIIVSQEDVPDPVFDYAAGEAEARIRCRFVRCWNLDCDDTHGYEWYAVKPPWVPTWVIRHTLLRYVVPDYSGMCPNN